MFNARWAVQWYVIALAVLAGGFGEPCPAATNLLARYERLYREARALADQQASNSQAAWVLARACFDLSEFATNDAQRAHLAREGIAAARASILLQSNAAPAHYYLGVNLGRLADATRNLGGLKLVAEMERCFRTVLALDPHFDFAGADRCLGLLYRDAPGWPISVGHRGKARHHLERACELAPEYPDNQLNLIEAWLKWGDKKQAARQLTKVRACLEEARKRFVGEEWALSWQDWDRRWGLLQKGI